ncbi:MAG TPA: hypothetical protein VGP99_03570 [Tepidisphaeraceae bacterium]|jgi:hypothetical protein|nr:hypothetical protein [Tepidisphaeraceae bacterium]
MPSRFEGLEPDEIDLARRYDIYVAETPQRVVVYRGAFIRGLKGFTRRDRFGISLDDFLEIEQANGDCVLVRRYSVIKLCEVGKKLEEEVIPPT